MGIRLIKLNPLTIYSAFRPGAKLEVVSNDVPRDAVVRRVLPSLQIGDPTLTIELESPSFDGNGTSECLRGPHFKVLEPARSDS